MHQQHKSQNISYTFGDNLFSHINNKIGYKIRHIRLSQNMVKYFSAIYIYNVMFCFILCMSINVQSHFIIQWVGLYFQNSHLMHSKFSLSILTFKCSLSEKNLYSMSFNYMSFRNFCKLFKFEFTYSQTKQNSTLLPCRIM